MKKKYLIPTAFIIIALAIIFLAISLRVESKNVYTVRSDDGNAELAIPIDALPQGVSLSDIAMAKVNTSEYFGNDLNNDSVVVYSLEPDGLEFPEPVTVTFEEPLVAQGEDSFTVPLIVHDGGEGGLESELLDIVGIQVNEDEGSMRVAASIDHFSHILRDLDGLFVVKRTPPDGSRYMRTESFSLVVTLNAREKKYVYDVPGKPGRSVEVTHSVGNGTTLKMNYPGVTRWTLGSKVYYNRRWRQPEITVGYYYLEPRKVVLKPDAAIVEKGYTFTQKYTCVNNLPDTLYFQNWSVDFTWQRSTVKKPGGKLELFREEKRTDIYIPGAYYECYEPLGPEGKPYWQSDVSDSDFICIGPPYTIICGDGSSFSGYTKVDEKCNPQYDAAGNPIDDQTGKAVLCGQ